MTVTATMRAMVLERPGRVAAGPLVLREIARPEAGPGMLVMRVNACGVCRTDLQLCEGDLEARELPIVPGHQVVGTVESVGEGATEGMRGAPWRPSQSDPARGNRQP